MSRTESWCALWLVALGVWCALWLVALGVSWCALWLVALGVSWCGSSDVASLPVNYCLLSAPAQVPSRGVLQCYTCLGFLRTSASAPV